MSYGNITIHIAQALHKRQCDNDVHEAVKQLEFDLVLFSSVVIDYDYIMALIARSTQKSIKQQMTHEQLINLISANANLLDERDDIIAYVRSLHVGEELNEQDIRRGYQDFKAQKSADELNQIARKHRLQADVLHTFVSHILERMIFDGEQLTDLLASPALSWKARILAEVALMEDLVPYLQKRAEGREISGLSAYE